MKLCSLLLFLLVPLASAAPNILLAIADDASYPHMGAYGTDWVKTPGFDRVAKEGLLFTRAYTPNAKCAPSRACILTGRNSWQLEAAANHWCYFPPKFKTWCEALAEADWHVGYTTKGWAPGVAKDAQGKGRQLTGKAWNKKRNKPPAGGINSCDYAGNFADFLDAAPEGKSWSFWYGCTEPHRGYEYQAGVKKGGKKLSDIDEVPAFWPDTPEVRNDMLDYAFEIEWFDRHLARMLKELDQRGQLANTLVVVTADNGMPFPRVKGQEYELSNHLPLAIMWPKGIVKPGRVIDDYVSFIDFAPTFFEVAGLDWAKSGMQPTPGRSLGDIFSSEKSGQVNPARDHVLIGKERHDIGRPNDWGYPIRGIVKDDVLYIRNYEPSRWPGGNPETGYLNCDGSPTKTQVLELRRSGAAKKWWEMNFGKRPDEELFEVKKDRNCVSNLATRPDFLDRKAKLIEQMERELKAQGDPRALGSGNALEQYPYANEGQRGFYEKFMSGKNMKAGWVNRGDFEKEAVE